MNVNSWCRAPFLAAIKAGLEADDPLPDVYEKATAAFQREAERHMHLYGSAGKA